VVGDDEVAVDDGLVDASWWRARQDEYLAAATTVLVPTSPINVGDHLERAARTAQRFDPSTIDAASVAEWCRRIDGFLDCADFDLLRLLVLWFRHRTALPPHAVEAIEQRALGFTYWYTDPVPEGVLDQRWYWSENHQLIFHAVEHLAGQAFEDRRFAATGMTGAQHHERASASLTAWFDDKVELGFSEWHSDAYLGKDLAPLLALAELSSDASVAARAAAFVDLVLYDLAVHSLRDNMGSTHGRSYMRLKASAPTQAVFGAMKLCFDRTDEPWPLDPDDPDELLPANEAPALLAWCRRYRPPDVLRRVARSSDELVDHEHMGVRIDPSEPLVEHPVRADGRSWTDPAMVPFWWDRGALTPWQLIPLLVETLDRYRLWDAPLFHAFRSVRDALGGDVELMRHVAADLHPMVNAGLLAEVDTITWRNGHAMLSTAQAYRPGCAGFQFHIGQATLDEHAVVFTNHPGNPASPAPGDYRDDDRYWTGSATLPLAVQHDRTAWHVYTPAFAPPELDVLSGFSYLDHTHAYVPTERFDEVLERDHWVFARRRGGYVALWSWRRPTWREHDPATVFTNGLCGRFDLVALGGPDNVWLLHVGDVDQHPDLESFAAACRDHEPEVHDHGWAADGAHRGFDAEWRCPGGAHLRLGSDASLRVDGRTVALHRQRRWENRWTLLDRGATRLRIEDEVGGFDVDLGTGSRRPT
jgi:hypothetical protein